MYDCALKELPHRVKLAVLDLIEETPKYKPYDELKHTVITRMNEIYETRARRILPNVELGNRSPSELLAHMRHMVEGTQIGDMELRPVWIKCMPAKMRPYIGYCSYDLSLDDVAKHADDMHRELQAEEKAASQSMRRKAKRIIDSAVNELSEVVKQICELLDPLPCDRQQ
uniref:Late competence development protein ComFB n=1 Tax=Mesocestoides corti TaxID=53468 RepID=A0A5K3G209_MESCO